MSSAQWFILIRQLFYIDLIISTIAVSEALCAHFPPKALPQQDKVTCVIWGARTLACYNLVVAITHTMPTLFVTPLDPPFSPALSKVESDRWINLKWWNYKSFSLLLEHTRFTGGKIALETVNSPKNKPWSTCSLSYHGNQTKSRSNWFG